MASLDLAKIDIVFLEYIQAWLKEHPDYRVAIEHSHIEVWRRNQKTAPDKIANFRNANQLLEWIKKDATT